MIIKKKVVILCHENDRLFGCQLQKALKKIKVTACFHDSMEAGDYVDVVIHDNVYNSDLLIIISSIDIAIEYDIHAIVGQRDAIVVNYREIPIGFASNINVYHRDKPITLEQDKCIDSIISGIANHIKKTIYIGSRKIKIKNGKDVIYIVANTTGRKHRF